MPESKGKIKSTKVKKRNQLSVITVQARLLFVDYYVYISIGVCVVLFIAGTVLLLWPMFTRARLIATKDIAAATAEQAELVSSLAYFKKLDAAYQSIEPSDFERLHAVLPQTSNTPEMLTIIEGLAKETGVIVKNIQFSVIESNKAIEAAKLAGIEIPKGIGIVESDILVATSPYSSVKAFIANIEKSIRLIDIVALNYSPLSDSYVITMRSYFQPKK